MDLVKELKVSLVGLLVVFLAVGLFVYRYEQQSIDLGAVSAPVTGPSGQTITIGQEEVAKHNLADSCWIIIGGRVYNVTQYLNFHPGGAKTILPFCGKEATASFETKGGRGRHSSQAIEQLKNFLLGALNEVIDSARVMKVENSQPPEIGGDDD